VLSCEIDKNRTSTFSSDYIRDWCWVDDIKRILYWSRYCSKLILL